MLHTLRRGPASATSLLLSTSFCSQCIRAFRPRTVQRCLPRVASQLAPRPFGTSPPWRRNATAAAVQEDELFDEVNAEQPPSNSQLNAAVKHGPVTRFEDLAGRGLVCQTVVDTITKDMGLETMTQVQSLTLNESLKGTDILAQARTGTGKTLAFLLPILQNIINVDPRLERRSRSGLQGDSNDIRAIIISPTRELAEQIAVEAKKVCRNTGVIVQTAVGGMNKAQGLYRIRREGCHILVGTPGRLNDILSDPSSQVRAPNLSAFVLDEADRLLDQGFAPEIQAIQDQLPNRRDRDRQTLLYSATVPREVMSIVRRTMKPNFQFVRTVQEGEEQTHQRVPQKLVNVGGFENLLPALVELCKREISGQGSTTGLVARPFKAIVYFGATADVSMASATLGGLRDGNFRNPLAPARLIEMHARLTQMQRTRAANDFRRAESAIMLSSDVTARGMDFPNVTHVIQVGLPPTQEQYVHRIGRTARGDKSGEGWMLITDLERRELRKRLPEMRLQRDTTLETPNVDMKKDAQLPESIASILTQVLDASRRVPRGLKAASYQAALGIYQWVPRKQDLVDAMNSRARYGWGMEEPPSIGQGLATKLGLGRLQGINIGQEEPRDYSSDNSSSGFRRSSFGGQSRGSGGFNRGRSSYSRGGNFGQSSYGGGDRSDRGGFGRSSYGGGDRSDRGGFGRSSYGGGERGGSYRDFPRGGRDNDRGGFGSGGSVGRRDSGREGRYTR